MLRELHLETDARLVVGPGLLDDAAIFRMSDDLALVQTVDFLTPIVDDARTFGRIAAANALSDVYAMAGDPITALNIVCFPKQRPITELIEILRGGAQVVAEAGAVVVGGHTVDDLEPKFGLSVTGVVDPRRVTTNGGARPGDRIILTKPLGTGIIATAAKLRTCDHDLLHAACDVMSVLNAAASRAMRRAGIGQDLTVHAATDVSGYGLLGHLQQVAKASEVTIELRTEAIPLLRGAEELAAGGIVTGGDDSNRRYVEPHLSVQTAMAPERLSVLLDPQTSGGLGIFVAEDHVEDALGALRAEGVETTALVGRVLPPAPPTRIVLR